MSSLQTEFKLQSGISIHFSLSRGKLAGNSGTITGPWEQASELWWQEPILSALMVDHPAGGKIRAVVSSGYFNTHLTYWMLVNVGYHYLEGWPNPLQTIEVLLVGYDVMSQKLSALWRGETFTSFCVVFFLPFFLSSFKGGWHAYCTNIAMREASWKILQKDCKAAVWNIISNIMTLK